MARDPETQAPLGGLTGRTSLGVLFIDLFYLPAELRGGGLGRRLLQLAEAEGRRRGCAVSILYTISFQAPAFYEPDGYRVFGTIPPTPPPGHDAGLHEQDPARTALTWGGGLATAL